MTQKPHQPTIDDLINLPDPRLARISPDGCHVAYEVKTPNWERNERSTQIWLAGATRSEPVQITFAGTSSRMPCWSPDGKWLAFLSLRGEDKTPQIYRINPFGGEAQAMTHVEGAIHTFEWAPDGKNIAFRFTESEDEALKKRREKYGEYRVDDVDYQFARLWLLDIETQKTEALTGEAQKHIVTFEWSPDGKKIAFEAWSTPEMKDYTNGAVKTIDLETHDVEMLVETHSSKPIWSPDGSRIAYLHHAGQTMADNAEVCILDAQGGEQQVVSAQFDGNPMLQAWTKAGIFFAAIQHVSIPLFCLDPDKQTMRQVSPDDPPGWTAMQYSFSPERPSAACVAANKDQHFEVVLLDLESGTPKPLTGFNDAIAHWQLAEKEAIRWRSHDGLEIEGILTKPVDFDDDKQYPLLVVIHGGPTSSSLLAKLVGPEKRFYPIQQWASKGAMILEPNYRGSEGYGEEFRKRTIRNLGVGDYWDVISGVDHLIEKGWVDPQRVGAMGWSQGGYISAFLTTYSDRFKAVSVGAGISNWVTYYVNTDIHPFTRDYLGATPWEDMEIYRKTSPMTYINQAKTPTLIQHGDQDFRVPIPNAFELYQGLIDVGVEAKLIVYPGMPHATDKPRTQRQIMQSNEDWFNRWIWDEQPDEETEHTLYIAIPSSDRKKEPKNLPAVERYTGKLLQDVHKWARRDQAGFYIFSAEFGLIEADFPTPPEQRALMPEDVSPLSIRITDLLRNENAARVILFTPPSEDNPWVLVYLGCLQVAAGLAGMVHVEHREIA